MGDLQTNYRYGAAKKRPYGTASELPGMRAELTLKLVPGRAIGP